MGMARPPNARPDPETFGHRVSTMLARPLVLARTKPIDTWTAGPTTVHEDGGRPGLRQIQQGLPDLLFSHSVDLQRFFNQDL